MAVVDYFETFEPVEEPDPRSAVLEQAEAKTYSRVGRHVQAFVDDLRWDVDDAFSRLGSALFQNPDDKDFTKMLGVALVDGKISNAAADNTPVFKGNYAAEKDGASPSSARAVIGSGNGELTLNSVFPGAGSDVHPCGNRILITFRNPGTLGAALAVDSAIIELGDNGRKFFAVDVSLGTDGAGALDPAKNTATLVAAALNGDADISYFLKITAGGTGADAVGEYDPFQLEGGEGGIYCVMIGSAAGAWEKASVTTWTDTAITMGDIDGTAHTVDDTLNFLVLVNGLQLPISVHVVA
jgi:hypothetical protein